MPNKTLYVKESDLPLFEHAQEQLGESISSIFADFLRQRVANLTPEEDRILGLIEATETQREALDRDMDVPRFLVSEAAEAGKHAKTALTSLRRGEVRQAKVHFYLAKVYQEKTERDFKEWRDLSARVAEMLTR